MRRVAFLFVLAVFAPSLVLAWLAVSSLRDQQYVLERQLALVYQGLADRMTRDAEDYLAERQREFAARVETLLDGSTPGDLAVRFDDAIRQQWPFADVGFTVQLPGTILSPAQSGRPEARKFWIANSGFLANREPAAVFWNSPRNFQNVGPAGEPQTNLAQAQTAPRSQPFSQTTTPLENAGGQAGDPLNQTFLSQNARPTPRVGVPAGAREKIFEQFYRAHDSLSSGIQGSGLGLTLARQIARAHGGDVIYQRREGGGSCFSLRLPCSSQS